ncbi:EAL domain-containing protein [Methylomonas sp. SURF-2]|uniref:EAL domain-containing protein n=1 Tax=Methylomonas subterranea TaxID=2952225 RepID=A0ABT1THS7_9GAMM|nr:EAL domain-containing protein [Methylomonas sp. SURF-2]MCQ8105014.1 EAL domain-containing protein [Methylomonas sp. SURF-2]
MPRRFESLPSAQRKILLVEDSKAYQGMFRSAFSETDYQLAICDNGRQALELIREQYMDFVCSSFYLKDMEGIELCKAVRDITKNVYKPFVLLTSVDSQDLLKKALPSGVTDIFQKRDINQLLAYIRRFPFQGQKSTGRILYVEDSRSQREMVCALLQARNLKVDAFASADEAWAYFLAEDYDLVLTDIVLDGMMSGLNFVNLIRRQLGSKGDTPVVAITAFDDRTRRLQLFNLGITDYIIKPVVEEELFVRINNLLLKQHALRLVANYDILTHLPNRNLFAERFNLAIANCNKHKTLLAVCYLDLDGFKQINDRFGRDMGDGLLIEVAARIREVMRPQDNVSRQGGDEFALLFADLESQAQCEAIVSRMLASIAEPYFLNGQTLSIAASCGVTFYPRDDADPDTLLRHADQAMYQAKLGGRNCYQLFDTSREKALQVFQRQLAAIKQAMERDEFCLYYQPKVDMQSDRVFGMEALIRWNHPTNGMLSPAAFLHQLAGTELELALDTWVIGHALQQLELWNEAGLKLQVGVNISPKHIKSAGFFADLSDALRRYDRVDPRQFQIEVLESGVLDDLATVSQVIQNCRDKLGISIALDDFGTGYSSLSHLRHLPIQTIKIDQSFVRDMIEDPSDHAIVEGVISLARAFKLEVIAEGVETERHKQALLELGCAKAQGYGIARPMPADKVHGWIRNYQR